VVGDGRGWAGPWRHGFFDALERYPVADCQGRSQFDVLQKSALSQNIATNVSRCGIRELGVVGELNLRQGPGENQHLKVT
jgi:hypothetical protein